MPRDKLIALRDENLQRASVSMVTHLLQPLNVRTTGDDSGTERMVARGVTQGDQQSPPVFMIFVNPLSILQRTIESPTTKPSNATVVSVVCMQMTLSCCFGYYGNSLQGCLYVKPGPVQTVCGGQSRRVRVNYYYLDKGDKQYKTFYLQEKEFGPWRKRPIWE